MSDASGAAVTAPAAEPAPRTDRLELLQQLNGATVGVVHKARNPKLNRTLVLRQLQVPEWLDDVDELIKRILAEARAASALDHPNIARLYTGGYKGFTVFLTSEFAEGTNIKQFAASRNLGIADLIALGRQLCAALDCAHEKNVMHYALNPANLKVTSEGALKVLDFGLLRDKQLYSPTPAKRLESEHYLSPEQLKGKPITRASNLFSAATILYELFTTRNPFAGKHLGEVDRNIAEIDPSPANIAHARVPEAVSRVLMKALAKNPQARFQTGAEFATALEEAFNGSPGRSAAAAKLPPSAAKPNGTEATPAKELSSAPMKPAAAPAQTAAARPANNMVTMPATNASPQAPKAPTTTTTPTTTKLMVVRSRPASAPTSKMPAKILAQWKLVGGIIAALFVVSAVAISLNHRSKIAAAAPEISRPEQTAVQGEKQTESTTPLPSGVAEPQTVVSLREVQPRGGRVKTARGGTAAAPAAVAEGQLFVSSEPAGASITIEGKSLDSWKTPQTLGSLAPGVYQVTLSKAGYASETRSIEVTSGNRAALDVKLSPTKATLNVGGTPTGARILIDGKETGKFTPAEFALDPATHTVTLRKEGYFDSSTNLKLAAGQSMSYAPSMTAAGRTDNIKVVGGFKKLFGGGSSEGMSRMEFKTEPKGAEVEINGTTLPKTTPFEVQLEPGNYEITLQKEGYKPVHKSVTTQANQKLKIEQTLSQ
ncbi:MAG TPA: serine/threonine-protein kinase [Candidatus Angelobacter sp.]